MKRRNLLSLQEKNENNSKKRIESIKIRDNFERKHENVEELINKIQNKKNKGTGSKLN